MRPDTLRTPRLCALAAVFLGLLGASCGGGGSLTPAQAQTAGDFMAVNANVPEGAVWELNRVIRIEFNHPVDPLSIGFQSIRITTTSQDLGGRPVTGSFELDPSSGGKVVIFRPNCPTNDSNDNGAFVPGGYGYRLELPTQSSFGGNVLRDTGGHQLVLGLSRNFVTPVPPSQPLFLDTVPTPPSILSIDWPERLNLFTDPEPLIAIHFNQPIDGRSSNLNGNNLAVYYSDGVIGSGAENTFSNKLPGTLVLGENCGETGATVNFMISGLLPPGRNLEIVMENTFRDIVGQTNEASWTSPYHATPTLEQVYRDAGTLFGWTNDDVAIDEFSDFFADASMIDTEAGLSEPLADIVDGGVVASFHYPGQFVPPDRDFYWNETSGEIFTDGQLVISDSNNRTFTLVNGVLYCDDFTIENGASLRARGTNPLIIYAQGEVRILGTIDVSGNDSHWPTSLNSPQFPEGPILGECGGGLGGMSSREGLKETLRGDPGDGPFQLTGLGGGGGEGGFQQSQNVSNGGNQAETANLLAGGGGGGTFALTPNMAIWWAKWTTHQKPASADNNGPDHDVDRDPYWPDGIYRDPLTVRPTDLPVFGGEPGMRGSSFNTPLDYNPQSPPTTPHGVYGMEDEQVDVVDPKDPASSTAFDPVWTSPPIPFDYGHPTRGADPGEAGRGVFSDDGDVGNDFWGSRLNNDGSVTKGELLTPWAGYGGGAGGDSQVIVRPTVNGQMVPLPDAFPARPFPPSNGYYRKAAPGGGGAGQLQIMAIGRIALGANAKILANGGIGQGGESTLYTQGQISGSGGGSGGHIILHSATQIDLSAINIGSAATQSQIANLVASDTIQAIGGRRGWAGSWLTSRPVDDGNGDLMVGRGGAGGNGVIQIHVPDPDNNIIWPAAARPGLRDYLHHGDVNNQPLDRDRLDEVLGFFSVPAAYALLPFFSAGSQIQSRWIDTGLAFLRNPANGTGPFPDWSSSILKFRGVDSSGKVQASAGKVTELPTMASLPITATTFSAHELVLQDASAHLAGNEIFLRHPRALLGFMVLPDELSPGTTFQIVDASYDSAADTLTLATATGDGILNGATNPPNNWALLPKFFRISTTGSQDSLPASASVAFVFQGSNDPANPSAIIPGPNDWTADLSLLKGQRYLRYRIEFDIDAQRTGVSQASPKPMVEYVKIPFAW